MTLVRILFFWMCTFIFLAASVIALVSQLGYMQRFTGVTLVDDFDFGKPEEYLGEDFEVMGTLTVVETCIMLEGCGPTFKLWSSDFKSYLPLLPSCTPWLPSIASTLRLDSQRLVIARGKMIELPPNEHKRANYNGPTIALAVQAHGRLGDVKYHEHLIGVSTDCVIRRFGFPFSHDKSFGFEVVDDGVFFKVRWTYSEDRKLLNDRYYELWMDPGSGTAAREIDKTQLIEQDVVVGNQLTVKFKDGMAPRDASTPRGTFTSSQGCLKLGIPSIDSLNSKYGINSFQKLPYPPDYFRKYGLDRVYQLKSSHDFDMDEALESYTKDSSIEYAVANRIAQVP